MSKGKKVNIIVRGYFRGNIGDDLFLYLLSRQFPQCKYIFIGERKYLKPIITQSEHSIVVPIYYNKFFRALSKLIGLYSKSLREKMYLRCGEILFQKLSKKAKACVYIGGSLFMEGNTPIGISEKLNLLMAKYYHDSIFIIGCSFGPYHTQDYLDFYSNFWQKCRYVSFREKESYDLFSSQATRCGFYPDLIWGFTLPEEVVVNKGSFAFVVMDFSKITWLSEKAEAYEKQTAKLIDYLCENGKKVKLYSFCPADGDIDAAKRITKHLTHKYDIETVGYFGNLLSFIKDFLNNETIVSTRFHGIVLGLSSCRKVIPIIYHIKTEHMLDDLQFVYPKYSFDDYCAKGIDLLANDIVNVPTFSIPDIYRVDSKKHFSSLQYYIDYEATSL